MTAPPMPRVAAISGATGPLGRAVAAAFAEDGLAVAVLGRDRAELESLVRALPGGADRHAAVEVDPGDAAAVVAAASTIRDRLGPVGALVHAVGGYRAAGGIVEAPPDELDAMLDAHVRSGWNVLRAFLPDVRVAPGGRIVTFSTTTVATPGSTGAAYAAAKAGLEALTQSVARELAKSDATANVIVLRMIDGEKRSGTSTAEIVAAVRWLCSPAAAAVNGQRIPLVGRS